MTRIALLQMTSFQRNDGDCLAIESADPGDDCWIVTGRAIPMELDKLAEHPFEVIRAGKSPGAACTLHGIPGGNLRSISR